MVWLKLDNCRYLVCLLWGREEEEWRADGRENYLIQSDLSVDRLSGLEFSLEDVRAGWLYRLVSLTLVFWGFPCSICLVTFRPEQSKTPVSFPALLFLCPFLLPVFVSLHAGIFSEFVVVVVFISRKIKFKISLTRLFNYLVPRIQFWLLSLFSPSLVYL